MFEKVTAAVTLARTEVRNAVKEARTILASEKSTTEELVTASRALNVAGRLDTALTKAEGRIASSLKKLQPKAKKSKAKKGDAAPAAGKGK